MMNFDYIADLKHFDDLYDSCSIAEELVLKYPNSSAIKQMHALDYMVKFIINAKTGSIPLKYDLFNLMNTLEFKTFINSSELLNSLHYIRKIGQISERNEKITSEMSKIGLNYLYVFIGECLKKLTIIDSYNEFDESLLIRPGKNKINSNIVSDGLLNDSKQENSLYKPDIKSEYKTDIKSDAFQIYSNSLDLDSTLNYKFSLSEAKTRKIYIDYELQKAGWKIANNDNEIYPGNAGIEIKVEGMPNDANEGFCDYVLFSKAGLPIAVIEAKKTSVNPIKGRQQAVLYCECLVKNFGLNYKPIIYYTNGYTINIIDQLGYPDREVLGYLNYDDLMLNIQRQNRGKIKDLNFKKEIADRPYQITSLTKIVESFNENRRKALLVLATGSGKTRIAVSLCEILTRHDWIKNILFLADRTSLVSQASEKFAEFLPNLTKCVISDNSTKSTIDYEARVTLSTYQTILNVINQPTEILGVGRFDLIIVDEAHRYIFNKYGNIFKYFDSLLVGLTATPRDDIKNDKSTYDIFELPNGEPTYSYDMEQAVKEGYLVSYRCFDKTTERLKRGVKYSDLSDEDKKNYENAFDDLELVGIFNEFKGSDFFKKVYNKKTCELVLQTLMENGLKIENGEKLGRTIIFAYNHKHAEMIVKCFNKLYPQYGPNFCLLIDNYVNYNDSLIKSFCNKKEPQIAVSVDMLDTGVDATDVLNLVFFKEVNSKIKFIQMIGRGTRTCKNLNVVSPSKDYFNNQSTDNSLHDYDDKQGFYIFDWCGNFEYFGQNPNGKDVGSTLSLSQRIYAIKLEMAESLSSMEYQSNEDTKNYYDSIIKELRECVLSFNRDLLNVKGKLPYVDKYSDEKTWENMSPISYLEVHKHIVPLVLNFDDSEIMAKRFDYFCWLIEKNIFAKEKLSSRACKFIYYSCEYLYKYKATVKEVLNKKTDLDLVLQPKFFEKILYTTVEKIRFSLRDIMKYVDITSINLKVSMDISDDVIDNGDIPFDPTTGIKTYEQKVIEYLLENVDKPVIQKIKNLDKINVSDLNELEDILWNQLGTKDDYDKISHQDLPAFVRKIVGLEQSIVNKKLSEYFSMDSLTGEQQEFIRQIILYVRMNGDITIEDIRDNNPFANYDLNELFEGKIEILGNVLRLMHDPIVVE